MTLVPSKPCLRCVPIVDRAKATGHHLGYARALIDVQDQIEIDPRLFVDGLSPKLREGLLRALQGTR